MSYSLERVLYDCPYSRSGGADCPDLRADVPCFAATPAGIYFPRPISFFKKS